jgi:hypothetical protein
MESLISPNKRFSVQICRLWRESMPPSAESVFHVGSSLRLLLNSVWFLNLAHKTPRLSGVFTWCEPHVPSAVWVVKCWHWVCAAPFILHGNSMLEATGTIWWQLVYSHSTGQPPPPKHFYYPKRKPCTQEEIASHPSSSPWNPLNCLCGFIYSEYVI